MKKIISFVILIFFFSTAISAQKNMPFDLQEKSENDLFQKDWSSFDNLIAGEPKMEHHDFSKLGLKSDIKLGDLVFQDIVEARKSNRKVLEMPIHKPNGNHHMPIHEIDTTRQYYLKILTVE